MITVWQFNDRSELIDRETRLSVRDPMPDDYSALSRDEAEAKIKQMRVEAARDLFASGHYERVAHVETDDLHIAHRLTQNGAGSWSLDDRAGVIVCEPRGIDVRGELYGRSDLNLGDLLQQGDEFFVVGRGFDFDPVGKLVPTFEGHPNFTSHAQLVCYLRSLVGMIEVAPVTITIEGQRPIIAARYTQTCLTPPGSRRYQEGEREYLREMIFAVADRPVHKQRRSGKVAYVVDGDEREWFVSSWSAEQHANKSFLLAPWDAPDTKVDTYAKSPYTRVKLAVEAVR